MTQPAQRVRLDSGANKSMAAAMLLCVFLGIVGAHWYYLGRPAKGVAYTLTMGVFLIGWIVDIFKLPNQVRRINTIGF